jgi:hypothetical protein
MPRWITRKRVLLGAALAVFVGGLVTGYDDVVRPLRDGSVSGLQGSLDPGEMPDNDPWTIVLPYRDHVLVHGLVSLRNAGRLPVRVERVGEPPEAGEDDIAAFRPEENVLNGPNLYDYDGPSFRPFTLGPGDERAVSVALWLDHCETMSPDSFVRIETIPVRVRVLGFAHTQEITMSDPWTVAFSPDTDCPRGKWVRS